MLPTLFVLRSPRELVEGGFPEFHRFPSFHALSGQGATTNLLQLVALRVTHRLRQLRICLRVGVVRPQCWPQFLSATNFTFLFSNKPQDPRNSTQFNNSPCSIAQARQVFDGMLSFGAEDFFADLTGNSFDISSQGVTVWLP